MFDLKKVYGAHVGSGQCFVVRLAFVHQVSYLFSRVITNVKKTISSHHEFYHYDLSS